MLLFLLSNKTWMLFTMVFPVLLTAQFQHGLERSDGSTDPLHLITAQFEWLLIFGSVSCTPPGFILGCIAMNRLAAPPNTGGSVHMWGVSEGVLTPAGRLQSRKNLSSVHFWKPFLGTKEWALHFCFEWPFQLNIHMRADHSTPRKDDFIVFSGRH